jgi:hypothetical protein
MELAREKDIHTYARANRRDLLAKKTYIHTYIHTYAQTDGACSRKRHTYIHTYIHTRKQTGLAREKDNELKKIVFEFEMKTAEHRDQVFVFENRV